MPSYKTRRYNGHSWNIDVFKHTKAEATKECVSLKRAGYKTHIFPTSGGYEIGIRH